jgi:rod shape-determining protein MreC
VLGVLVLLSLVLITISFREGETGPLHDAQGAVASVLQPFQVAVERVARPFRDAYGWTASLLDARSEAERLRAENEQIKQQLIQNESTLHENVTLRRLLEYRDSPSFPQEFRGVAAEVISRPARAFEQEIVVSAGSDDGVTVNAPVVTADGLVGQVTSLNEGAARVRLLTDESSAVSAVDLRTGASGIVRHGPIGDSLFLDYVSKKETVTVGHEIVTAGWRVGGLASLYPANIPIGHVTFVGSLDADLYQNVQIASDVDFSSLDSVLVLIGRRSGPELP